MWYRIQIVPEDPPPGWVDGDLLFDIGAEVAAPPDDVRLTDILTAAQAAAS
jgi:hypothetical protein